MTARLEMDCVSKRFGDVWAVRDATLTLAAGEFVTLLGPSGCGKSTTLSLVAGFEDPTGGTIRIDGASVRGVPPERRPVGLVFQDYAVFSHLTVRGNLAFGLEAQGIPRHRRHPLIDEMAERLDLLELLDHSGAHLNMSEMQRVALARALLTKPAILLLDEPMSNIDGPQRAKLRTSLRAMQRDLGQTILYVTHDQAEALSLSDRIVVMKDGGIEQVGTPDEIYARPHTRFVAEFIGEPPINLLTQAQARVLGWNGAAAEGALLGLRPESVALNNQPNGVEALVRFVDYLGAEEVLHLEHADLHLRALAPNGFARPGDRVGVHVPDVSVIVLVEKSRAP